MNPIHHSHLTPDQLDGYLIDSASLDPAGRHHLAACAECKLELSIFRSGLAAFNHATLAWAESRSSTLPPPETPHVRGAWHPLTWSSGALTAALAFAVVAFATLHHAPPALQESSIHIHQPGQIASDNQLLANIDEAVDAPVVSPKNIFEIPTLHSGAR